MHRSSWSTPVRLDARAAPDCRSVAAIRPGPDAPGVPGNQFSFEPNQAAVLRQLLPRYVATRIYQAILETTASEMSSKMVAMKSATENAEELIDDLTLSYNKVRQANITREMIEIASGARPGARRAEARHPHGDRRSTATGRVIQITVPSSTSSSPPASCPRSTTPWRSCGPDHDPLVCEVQQHLGNNWVRAVAMTTTDGLARGTEVRDTGARSPCRWARDAGKSLQRPWGRDRRQRPGRPHQRPAIHRSAPAFDEQTTDVEVFETGIKVIDWSARSRKAARSGSSAVPASARRSSSRS